MAMIGELLSILLLASFKAPARQPAAGLDPRSVVEDFCRLDAEGVFLRSDTAAPSWKRLTFDEGERTGYPVVVVSGYKVVGVRQEGDDYLVSVKYQVVGELAAGWDDGSGGLNPLRQERAWTFRVGRDGTRLAIRMSSLPLAHVLPLPLATYFREHVLPLRGPEPAAEAARLDARIRRLIRELTKLADSAEKK